jgi:hypothetical protein
MKNDNLTKSLGYTMKTGKYISPNKFKTSNSKAIKGRVGQEIRQPKLKYRKPQQAN